MCAFLSQCAEVYVSGSIVHYDYDIHQITPTATDLLIRFSLSPFLFISISFYFLFSHSMHVYKHLGSKFNGFLNINTYISHHFRRFWMFGAILPFHSLSIPFSLFVIECRIFSLLIFQWPLWSKKTFDSFAASFELREKKLKLFHYRKYYGSGIEIGISDLDRCAMTCSNLLTYQYSLWLCC